MEEKELTEFEWEMRELQQLVDPENYVPCISSAALMDQEFTPAEFVVKGFLPKGLCVLGGAPKIGKSWMMLDLCLHVAKCEPFLDMEVKQGTALYLSLEDTNDRIRQRLACITADTLDNFQITTREHEPGTMADSLPKTIDKFMGVMAYGKAFSNNYLDQRRINNFDRSTYMYVQGNYPPIVTEEEWHQVQAIKARASRKVLIPTPRPHATHQGKSRPMEKSARMQLWQFLQKERLAQVCQCTRYLRLSVLQHPQQRLCQAPQRCRRR